MKAVNDAKTLLGRSAIVVAAFAVTSVALTSRATAGDDVPSEHKRLANSIAAEVAKECKHLSARDVKFFVAAAPLGRLTATQEQEAKYLADEKNFADAQTISKCWTRERWTRYVHAMLEDERAKQSKFVKPKN
jgi:hypothetical protein